MLQYSIDQKKQHLPIGKHRRDLAEVKWSHDKIRLKAKMGDWESRPRWLCHSNAVTDRGFRNMPWMPQIR